MYLKPIFDDPNIKDQLPVENKKLNLVERIRERIMKIALNKPWVRVYRFYDKYNLKIYYPTILCSMY